MSRGLRDTREASTKIYCLHYSYSDGHKERSSVLVSLDEGISLLGVERLLHTMGSWATFPEPLGFIAIKGSRFRHVWLAESHPESIDVNRLVADKTEGPWPRAVA